MHVEIFGSKYSYLQSSRNFIVTYFQIFNWHRVVKSMSLTKWAKERVTILIISDNYWTNCLE